MSKLLVDENKVKVSNLTKIFWYKYGYTKGDLINYYIKIYPFIKDYLKDRPLALKIYPDGINGISFFQKNVPNYAPEWLSTYPIYSNHRKEAINWVIINKLSDLIWVVNKASIELHSWLSSTKHLNNPDFAVFDLDPGENSTFINTIEVAQLINNILNELKISSFIKTSGKSGLHIYIPIKPIYNYQQVKLFLQSVAKLVIKLKPTLTTTEWRKKERGGKIYIDYRQNEKGKTIPAPYSLRPTEKATISTPIKWEELTQYLKPTDFTLANIMERLKNGDIWANLLENKQKLPSFLF